MQARLFKFMPLIFMFMMGRFPAGLLIYWSWNNTLTIAQQWLIMRQTRIGGAGNGDPRRGAAPASPLPLSREPRRARARRARRSARTAGELDLEAGGVLFAAPCRFFFAAQRLDQLPPPPGGRRSRLPGAPTSASPR